MDKQLNLGASILMICWGDARMSIPKMSISIMNTVPKCLFPLCQLHVYLDIKSMSNCHSQSLFKNRPLDKRE